MESMLELITEKLLEWAEQFILLLPNLIASILVLIVGYWLSRWIRRTSGKFLDQISERRLLNNLFSTIIYVASLALVTFTALTILNLDRAVTSILAGIGILSLALAFAFQDIAANFISGILISVRRPVRVNDLIEVNGIKGRVEEVNLRDTVMRTLQGKKVIMPNKDIFQSALTNHTRAEKQRLDLECGVSYGEDLDFVKRIAIEALDPLENRTADPIELYYTEFDNSSINFMLFVWLNDPHWPVFLKARSDAIIRLKKAFDANDISIPFPIRTLDFGIKGGEKLDEMKFNLQGQES
ncbi:MAG: mechanosensitive ion channel [Balneolaceae bacterium]|nr:mechanosensitive ion channel [Balneolaceae bacterium]